MDDTQIDLTSEQTWKWQHQTSTGRNSRPPCKPFAANTTTHILTPPRPFPILNKLAAADAVRQLKNAEHQPEASPTQWQNNTPHWHNISYKAQLLTTSAKRMAQLMPATYSKDTPSTKASHKYRGCQKDTRTRRRTRRRKRRRKRRKVKRKGEAQEPAQNQAQVPSLISDVYATTLPIVSADTSTRISTNTANYLSDANWIPASPTRKHFDKRQLKEPKQKPTSEKKNCFFDRAVT